VPPPGYAPPPGYGWYLAKPAPFVPGLVFYAVTAFLALAGLYGASLPDLGGLAFLAVMAGLCVGLVWLIAFGIAANDTRMHFSRATWARWVGIPAMCFACLGLMMSGIPATTRFELSRPALAQAAADARSGTHFGPGWIGLMPVKEVRVVGPVALFVLSGSSEYGDECGIASGDSADSRVQSWLNGAYDVSDYGQGWWYWCTYAFSD
jgi:hypothetical protein